MSDGRFLGVRDVVARAQIHRVTIWRWMRAGLLPPPRTRGRVNLWPAEAVDAAITHATRRRRRSPRPVDPHASALARTRQRAGLTQATVAAMLGVGSADVSSWETGRHRPGRRYRRALASLLGAPEAVLFPDTDGAR